MTAITDGSDRVEWRSFCVLVAAAEAAAAGQARAPRPHHAKTGRVGGPGASPYVDMAWAYIRWKAWTPFSCFTLKRPRW